MKIYTELSDLSEFEPWSGAVDTYNKIIEADKGEEFISELDGIYEDGMTETQLNDLLWFESEWCFELVGLNSYGVEPIEADEILDNHSEIIECCIDEYVCEYISEHEKYSREDFKGIEPSYFEGDIDDWLEDNQGDETDTETLINRWLDDVGEDIIREKVYDWVN